MIDVFLSNKFISLVTVNIYFVPQVHKAPQGHNSVITCRIDLKPGENVFTDLGDKMHFDSLPYDHPSGKTLPGA